MRCIAYRDDGRICANPATVADPHRGGYVCAAHAPKTAQSSAPTSETPAHDMARAIRDAGYTKEQAIDFLLEKLSLPAWCRKYAEGIYEDLMKLGEKP